MTERGTPEPGAAVFIDRDGTINVDTGYIGDPELVKLQPGSAEAIRMLNDAGVPAVVITNQSGIGRGYYTEADFELVSARLDSLLSDAGARTDAMYFCPHTPDAGCGCRKPEPGMIERAAAELGVDPKASYVVGDKVADMGLARAVGARAVMVLTGYGKDQLGQCSPPPDFVAKDLRRAVEWILDDMGKMRPFGVPRCGR